MPRPRRHLVLAPLFLGAGCGALADGRQHDAGGAPCSFTPATDASDLAPGLIIGAEVLLPEGSRAGPGRPRPLQRRPRRRGGVRRRARGGFPTPPYSTAGARRCCRPGSSTRTNTPRTATRSPMAGLNPGYVHRDEWRLGTDGALPLPIPERIAHAPGDVTKRRDPPRHGTPSPARRAPRRSPDPAACRGWSATSTGTNGRATSNSTTTKPTSRSFRSPSRPWRTCGRSAPVGRAHRFARRAADDLAFMAYVPHVGEGRKASCAARAEVARYLRRVPAPRPALCARPWRRDRTGRTTRSCASSTSRWSGRPRSNLALYGETVDIAGAMDSGVRIALSTDWSPSGSFHMREEVRCARRAAAAAGRRAAGRRAVADVHRPWRLRPGARGSSRRDQAGHAGGPGARRVRRAETPMTPC